MPIRRTAARVLFPTLAALTLTTACSSGEIEAPPEPTDGSITVDASAGWAYLSLADEAVVGVTEPTTSPAWDIAFNATRVMLNGGAAGPGGVTGYCLCQNAAASDPDVVAFTAESEAGDFDQVTAAQVPAGASFEAEALVPALRGWYTGAGTAALASTGTTWLLRLDDGVGYAKLRPVSLTAPTDAQAGQVALEYAVQPAADQPFGAVRTVTLDASSATALDLASGVLGPSVEGWDLRLDGFTIRLNGGVSGSGIAAATTTTEDFASVATAAVDSRAFQQDGFAGVFNSHPWYRYNLTGENIIHPTFDVFLVRRGTAVYKLQLVDYYGPAGEPRRITVRYALLNP
jgi:hypothetical protein